MPASKGPTLLAPPVPDLCHDPTYCILNEIVGRVVGALHMCDLDDDEESDEFEDDWSNEIDTQTAAVDKQTGAGGQTNFGCLLLHRSTTSYIHIMSVL